MKINKKEVKEWAVATFLCVALCLPELVLAAPTWHTKTKNFLDDILTGLEYLGYGIGAICFVWAMFEIIWNGKRLPDMKNWFIGAAGFASFGTIVGMFFTKK